MPVWNVAAVEEEPSLVLRDWRVYEVRGVYEEEGLSRHFVGTRIDELSGRVSSGIKIFDAARRRGTTSSGRVYQLLGRPGSSPDGDYVWAAFCRINAVREVRDVTVELLEQVGRVTRESPKNGP